jgi:hypothetical protein
MLDEDFSVFFDVEDGFAVEAVFGLEAGDATRPVIFHDPTQPVEMYDSRVEADAPFLMIQEEHTEGLKRGVSVEMSAGSFRVERVTRDGTGLALVFLS